MATQTVNQILKTRTRGSNAFDVANASQIYAGMGVGTNAAGFLVPITDVTGLKFEGVAEHDALGNTGVSPSVTCRVDDTGPVLLGVPVTGASTIANVNDLVYTLTDNLLTDLQTAAATNIKAVGKIVRFNSSTSFDVQLFTAAEHLALN